LRKGFYSSIFKELPQQVSVYKSLNFIFTYLKGVITRGIYYFITHSISLNAWGGLNICYQSAWRVGRWERAAVVVSRDHIKGTRLM
jgi:hypothetical protein